MLRARRCRHDDRDLSHRPHCSRRGRGWWRHRFLGVSPACRRRRRHRRLECRGRRSRRHPGRGRTARTTVRISCRRRPRPRDAAFDDREPSRGRPRRQRRRRGHGAVLAPTARLPHRVFRSSPHHQPSIRLHELPDRCRSTDRRCSPGGDGEHLLDRLERAAPPRWLRRRKGGSRFTHSIHGDGVGSPWHPGQQCRTRHRQHPRSGRPVDDPDDPLAKGITLGRRGTPTDIATRASICSRISLATSPARRSTSMAARAAARSTSTTCRCSSPTRRSGPASSPEPSPQATRYRPGSTSTASPRSSMRATWSSAVRRSTRSTIDIST